MERKAQENLDAARALLALDPAAVHVSHATMDDLRSAPFDRYEQIVASLTGCGLAELLPYGRVRVEAGAGDVLWEWPTLAGGVGYCLTCHRQHTLAAAGGAFRWSNCG